MPGKLGMVLLFSDTTMRPTWRPLLIGSMSDQYAEFHGQGGTEQDRQNAAGVFEVGARRKVVSRDETHTTIEGIAGQWSADMFDIETHE